MADTNITLEELIGKLGKFQETTTQQCLDMLREEIPIASGNMLENTKILSMTKEHSVIGIDVEKVPYAEAVLNGRGPVYPDPAKLQANPRHSLMYIEYEGEGTSIHTSSRGKLKGSPGDMIFSKSFGPAEGNDFIGRTVQKILSADLDVGGFKGWARRNITRPVSQFFKNLWKR